MVVWPLVFLFFRSAHEDPARVEERKQAKSAVELPGLSFAEAVRDREFYQLLWASVFFAFTVTGTTVHFVPILIDSGAQAMTAAGIASIIGVSAFIGRIGMGVLLDRYRAHILGGLVCTLPAISCMLLLWRGDDPVVQSVAAALLGLTVGGEIDVIAYLTTRQFGLRKYGTIYGSMTAAMNVGTATGALLAGTIFDWQGSYDTFLFVTIAAMLTSSLALGTINKSPFKAAH
jgi:predicted MFS family arabinose efflux permease